MGIEPGQLSKAGAGMILKSFKKNKNF